MTEERDRYSVVIIDDDELVSQVLTLVLEDDFDVRSYATAEEALQAEKIPEVDAFITDIHLPGMDGIEFLERIHAIDQSASVIVITGYNDIDLAVSAMKKGACDFILKPFKNDQIFLAVEKGVDKKLLRKENIKLIAELRDKNRELENLNRISEAHNVEMENELDIARNLQKCLFPLTLPTIAGVEFTIKFVSAKKISGDFFDFIPFNDGRFGFILVDVSGHGVPAALYAAMLKSAMDSCIRDGFSPEESVGGMNRFMIDAQKKMSYNYATVFYGIFDFSLRTLAYCNAGIPSPVILRGGGGIDTLEPNSPFVGIFRTSVYGRGVIGFERGDKFLFYTDGSFECANGAEELFGHQRFMDLLDGMRDRPVSEIVENAYRTVEEFAGGTGFTDDITILGMKYSPPAPFADKNEAPS